MARQRPAPTAEYLQKPVNGHCVLPLAYRIGADPRILDVVAGILGPDILIYGVEFFISNPTPATKSPCTKT